jgi:hypothetical protein
MLVRRADALKSVQLEQIQPDLIRAATMLKPAHLAIDLAPARPAPSPRRPKASTVRDAAMALAAKVAEAASLAETEEEGPTERFLAFPPGSIGIDLSREFSLIMLLNLVGEVATPVWRTPTRFLWDVWEKEFLEVEVADVADSPEVLEARQQAWSLLTNADGTDSAMFTAYLERQQEYNEKLDEIAMSPDDEQVRRALLADLERINTLWLTRGFKVEVEDALDVLASFGRRSPMGQFADARERRDNIIFRRTDPDSLMEYPATNLVPSPTNLSWARFRLSSDDIGRLAGAVDERFPSIKDSSIYEDLLIGTDQTNSTVVQVTGELAVIGCDRPWLDEELLSSRAWRIPDGAEPFCDGGAPPSGRMPAYAVKAVLARNIEIEGSQVAVGSNQKITGSHPATSFVHRGRLQSVDNSRGHLTLSPARSERRETGGVRVVGFVMQSPGLAPDPDPDLF